MSAATRGEIQTIVAARHARARALGVHRRRATEHGRDPGPHGPQPGPGAGLRVGHDRRQAVSHPALDRRRRARRDGRCRRLGSRDVQLLDRARADPGRLPRRRPGGPLWQSELDRDRRLRPSEDAPARRGRRARDRIELRRGDSVAPHTKRTLSPKLDFRTTVGHGDGPGDRERLGFRGRGPTAVITDLGVLEPDPETWS